MHAFNAILAVVAVATTCVHGRLLANSFLLPTPTHACCTPKLCTGEAVIKGTTTQLTYLCAETKTATVFVIISDPNETAGEYEKTTTKTFTSKSTLFVTSTLHIKPSSSTIAKSSVTSEASVSEKSVIPSTSPFVTESQPELIQSTTTVHIVSKETVTISETVSNSLWTSGSVAGGTGTGGISASTIPAGIWLNMTRADATGTATLHTKSAGVGFSWPSKANSTVASGTTSAHLGTGSSVTRKLRSTKSFWLIPSPVGPLPSESHSSKASVTSTGDNFVSLPHDTELFTRTSTDLKHFPTITEGSSFAMTTTEGIFFSSGLLQPYPTPILGVRDGVTNGSHMEGTASKVVMITTITVHNVNSTTTTTHHVTHTTTKHGVVGSSLPGATTQALGTSGGGNVKGPFSREGWVLVVIVGFHPLLWLLHA